MTTQPLRSGDGDRHGIHGERELGPHRGHGGGYGAGGPAHHHVSPISEYLIIFAILMVLLAVTVWASFVDLKAGNIVVMYLIAIVKGVLIVMFFMHVRHASKLTWIFSSVAFVWLSIMFIFTFNDYITRPVKGWGNPTQQPIRGDAMSDPKTLSPMDPRE